MKVLLLSALGLFLDWFLDCGPSTRIAIGLIIVGLWGINEKLPVPEKFQAARNTTELLRKPCGSIYGYRSLDGNVYCATEMPEDLSGEAPCHSLPQS